MTGYLVTGGTGFIGRYLLNELTRRRGAEVPKPDEELEEISPEAAAMAFLMKGIHF